MLLTLQCLLVIDVCEINLATKLALSSQNSHFCRLTNVQLFQFEQEHNEIEANVERM